MCEGDNAFGRDSNDEFLPDGNGSVLSRKQIAEYAGCILCFQHRIFLFHVYIYRNTARLIRWDRAGAVVTEPFDYIQYPEFLLSFLLRIPHMNHEEVGYDPAVVQATSDEIEGLKGCSYPIFLRSLFEEAFIILSPTIQKVSVDGRDFLIGNHHYSTSCLTGKGTKGYIAYDLAGETFCYLKDSWRDPARRPEHEIYHKLHTAQVENIATCVVGGDVLPVDKQSTKTQRYFQDEKARYGSDRRHYRMVLREVGLPLTGYRNSAELCVLIYNAFQGELGLKICITLSNTHLEYYLSAFSGLGCRCPSWRYQRFQYRYSSSGR